ncbi:MAG: 30S ribosomal protein S1 [Patescibacteria group bacterium]
MSALTKQTDFQTLIEEESNYAKIPAPGDIVKGTVISASKKEVLIDVPGLSTGVVRGREIIGGFFEISEIKPGDTVEATLLELENEKGQMELSFRYAGHQKAWDTLKTYQKESTIVSAKVIDANKGGLLVTVNRIPGFLPVSQLTPEHYPRIQGGDKTKILEKLKTYVGQSFDVKAITVDDKQEKLIVSEKAAWEETQKEVLEKYKVGDVVEGKITAVTDFGAFVEFGENLEGLVHISELAWQRIDDPKELFKVGQEIKAEIINIDRSKIFLSIKKLQEDPWKDIEKKFKVGDKVKGTVRKVNPFGLFVELDKNIHGLAHVSELSDKPVEPKDIANPGDELEFTIISIEPKEHRLGLSLKGKTKTEKKEKPAKETVEDNKE